MNYLINVSKNQREHTFNGDRDFYKFHFRIEHEGFEDSAREIIEELLAVYPSPEYKIDLYWKTCTSKRI